jgi:hypothetical protein
MLNTTVLINAVPMDRVEQTTAAAAAAATTSNLLSCR